MKNISYYHTVKTLLFICVIITCGINRAAMADTGYTLLVPPTMDGGVASIYPFYDSDHVLSLAYEEQYADRPSSFFSIRQQEGSWSSPQRIDVTHKNARNLHSVTTLSNGLSMAVMSSDDTDYYTLFGLTSAPKVDNDGMPIIPGMSLEKLRAVLANGQRLYYSVQVSGRWSTPIAIANTSRANDVSVVAGDDGSALLLFAKDADNNPTTPADVDYFYSLYRNGLWSQPAPVVVNQMYDYALVADYFSGEYLLAWVSDKDSSITKLDDSYLNYAVIGTNGAVKKRGKVVSELQNSPLPIIGHDDDGVHLIWASSPKSDTEPARPLWSSTYTSSWSAAVDTGLTAFSPSSGLLKVDTKGLLLTHIDGEAVWASLKRNGLWSQPIAIAHVNEGGLNAHYRQLHYESNGHLWLFAAGMVPTVGTDPASSNDGKGLYALNNTLHSDLALVLTAVGPERKRIGGSAFLEWQVANKGVLPSSHYQVVVRKDGVELARYDGDTLNGAANRNHRHELVMDNGQLAVELELLPASGDENIANNKMTPLLKVEPDYVVRTVRRDDETHFTADIIEAKGIAAATVKVEFYLIDGSQRSLLASGSFDPNSGVPISIQTTALIDKGGDFQVEVEVNGDRAVREDDFSNNKAAYSQRQSVDFEITQLYMSPNGLHLSVKNIGRMPVNSVDLLLTDDPAMAGKQVPGSTPWFYQTLQLDASGQVQLSLPSSDVATLNGEVLYAIVNPYGNTYEQQRNNNQRKLFLNAPVTPLPGSEPGAPLPGPVLAFEKLSPWCGNLQVSVINNGNEAAISSSLMLLNAGEFPVASELIPVVMPGSSQQVTTQGLASGVYQLQLKQQLMDGSQKSLTQYVTIDNNASCQEYADNDIGINAPPTIIPISTTQTQISVQLSASGYNTNYLKPLVRVPLTLELKQGITVLHSDTQVVYMPGGGAATQTEVVFILPRSELPATGNAQLTISTPTRDDESKAVNNQTVVNVTMEAL